MWEVRGLSSGPRQQQGVESGRSRWRHTGGVQSKEGGLLLSEVSEPPRDQDADSLCMWSPQHCHCHLPRGEQVGTGCPEGPGHQFLTTQSGALGFTGVDNFAPKDDALRIFAEYGK